MSVINLLASVICTTFEKTCGKWQCKKPEPKAFVIRFSVGVDHEKEEGYRHKDIALYAECNYVSVFVRDRWNVIPVEDLEYDEETDDTYVKKGKDYNNGQSEWKLLISHDSCWRSAVEEFIRENSTKLNTFDSRGDFYEIIPSAEFTTSG
jgi:hypothetical protein